MNSIYGIINSKSSNFSETVAKIYDNFNGVWHFENIILAQKNDLPQVSVCERYIIVYNGAITNYSELKKKLDSHRQINSDEEIILAAWAIHGQKAVEMIQGSFAFAIYDKQEKNLFLVRDRLGIKPLYWCNTDKGFAFSSNIRYLSSFGVIEPKISPLSLTDFLRYQTVHSPDTILENVKMLEPATILNFNTVSGKISSESYWNITNITQNNSVISIDDTRKEVKNLFFKAVEKNIPTNCSYCAFLSGGIDSSAVARAMAKISDKRIKTFNISFSEEKFDEAHYARYIAKMHNTEHIEIKLSPQQFLEHLPDALSAIDHPSGDGLNTWIASKFAKEAGIDVAFSGLGGDELFAGYSIFKRMIKLNKYQSFWKTPQSIRDHAGKIISALRPSVASAKISTLLSLPNFDFAAMYAVSRQLFQDKTLNDILNTAPLPYSLPVSLLHKQNWKIDNQYILKYVSMAEMLTYMQNILLRDSEQMSMPHDFEIKVPFLDRELVEFVLSLPDFIKYPHTPKKLLVESLPDLLPDFIVNRPKMGFVLPWTQWLKNELYDFTEKRIKTLAQREFFNEKAVLNFWNDYNKNNPNITYSHIWALVVLEEWIEAMFNV